MFTADQIVAHLVGDYLAQHSKIQDAISRRPFRARLLSAHLYVIPILFITNNIFAIALIVGLRASIDGYTIARWAVWLRRAMSSPFNPPKMTITGFDENTTPIIAALWFLIIINNVINIIFNGIVLHLCEPGYPLYRLLQSFLLYITS